MKRFMSTFLILLLLIPSTGVFAAGTSSEDAEFIKLMTSIGTRDSACSGLSGASLLQCAETSMEKFQSHLIQDFIFVELFDSPMNRDKNMNCLALNPVLSRIASDRRYKVLETSYNVQKTLKGIQANVQQQAAENQTALHEFSREKLADIYDYLAKEYGDLSSFYSMQKAHLTKLKTDYESFASGRRNHNNLLYWGFWTNKPEKEKAYVRSRKCKLYGPFERKDRKSRHHIEKLHSIKYTFHSTEESKWKRKYLKNEEGNDTNSIMQLGLYEKHFSSIDIGELKTVLDPPFPRSYLRYNGSGMTDAGIFFDEDGDGALKWDDRKNSKKNGIGERIVDGRMKFKKSGEKAKVEYVESTMLELMSKADEHKTITQLVEGNIDLFSIMPKVSVLDGSNYRMNVNNYTKSVGSDKPVAQYSNAHNVIKAENNFKITKLLKDAYIGKFFAESKRPDNELLANSMAAVWFTNGASDVDNGAKKQPIPSKKGYLRMMEEVTLKLGDFYTTIASIYADRAKYLRDSNKNMESSSGMLGSSTDYDENGPGDTQTQDMSDADYGDQMADAGSGQFGSMDIGALSVQTAKGTGKKKISAGSLGGGTLHNENGEGSNAIAKHIKDKNGNNSNGKGDSVVNNYNGKENDISKLSDQIAALKMQAAARGSGQTGSLGNTDVEGSSKSKRKVIIKKVAGSGATSGKARAVASIGGAAFKSRSGKSLKDLLKDDEDEDEGGSGYGGRSSDSLEAALTSEEQSTILENVDDRYATNSADTLFRKVSKAYVRSYKRVLVRKNRLPASAVIGVKKKSKEFKIDKKADYKNIGLEDLE